MSVATFNSASLAHLKLYQKKAGRQFSGNLGLALDRSTAHRLERMFTYSEQTINSTSNLEEEEKAKQLWSKTGSDNTPCMLQLQLQLLCPPCINVDDLALVRPN